jgi:hypothetical protein
LVADFDTGSRWTYLPFEELVELAVVKPRDNEEEAYDFTHLEGKLWCLSRFAQVRLENSSPFGEYAVLCVVDWQMSTMVQVNPQREALVGRDLPTRIGAKIELDFGTQTTTVQPNV